MIDIALPDRVAGAVTLPLLGLPVHLPSVLLWGLAATLVLTGLMYAAQALGFSRMGIPFLLGTVFTADRRRAELVGFVVHAASGMAFTLAYAVIFQWFGRAGWWVGAGLGLVHGFLVLTLGMQLLPLLHPRVASERDGPGMTRWLQPPGFLGTHYGRRTPIVAATAHVLFGLILGAGYRLV